MQWHGIVRHFGVSDAVLTAFGRRLEAQYAPTEGFTGGFTLAVPGVEVPLPPMWSAAATAAAASANEAGVGTSRVGSSAALATLLRRGGTSAGSMLSGISDITTSMAQPVPTDGSCSALLEVFESSLARDSYSVPYHGNIHATDVLQVNRDAYSRTSSIQPLPIAGHAHAVGHGASAEARHTAGAVLHPAGCSSP